MGRSVFSAAANAVLACMWPHGQSVQSVLSTDRGNWADRWFHGTRVGHTGPGYPSTRVLTSLDSSVSLGLGVQVFFVFCRPILHCSEKNAHFCYLA